MEIKLDPPKDDLMSNIEKLKLLLEEMKVLKDVFFASITKTIQEDKEKYEKTGLPKPVLQFQNRTGKMSDPNTRVTFKSFLFVLRQAIDKVFRIYFQLKPVLGYDKAANSFPDLSSSSGFPKNLKNILEKKYDFDEELVSKIEEWSDLLIVSRIIRNTLKVQASFQLYFIENQDGIYVKIVCPLLKADYNDKTLELLKKELTVDLAELRYFNLTPSFLESSIKMIEDILNLIEIKTAPNKELSL